MIHSHREHVCGITEFQMRREAAFETGITIGPAANEVAVDPDFGVVVNTFKFNSHEFGFGGCVETETFAIPAHTSRSEAGATGVFWPQRTSDAPIVRQI